MVGSRADLPPHRGVASDPPADGSGRGRDEPCGRRGCSRRPRNRVVGRTAKSHLASIGRGEFDENGKPKRRSEPPRSQRAGATTATRWGGSCAARTQARPKKSAPPNRATNCTPLKAIIGFSEILHNRDDVARKGQRNLNAFTKRQDLLSVSNDSWTSRVLRGQGDVSESGPATIDQGPSIWSSARGQRRGSNFTAAERRTILTIVRLMMQAVLNFA